VVLLFGLIWVVLLFGACKGNLCLFSVLVRIYLSNALKIVFHACTWILSSIKYFNFGLSFYLQIFFVDMAIPLVVLVSGLYLISFTIFRHSVISSRPLMQYLL
jgi:hypothetical protein